MMPIPPTTSETPAMPASRKVKLCDADCMALRNSVWRVIRKSFSTPGRSRCWRRRMLSISAIAIVMWFSDSVSTVIALR